MAESSGPEDDDPLRESRAYNTSIYFMVGMPYLLLVGFLVMIALTVVRHQRAVSAQAATPRPPTAREETNTNELVAEKR